MTHEEGDAPPRSEASPSDTAEKRPTLMDVARAAGTSKATASRVLSGRQSDVTISAATIARVQEAARALNFQPNAAAKALSTRRSKSIAVVLPGGVDSAHAYHRFSHLKLSEFLSGVDAITRERDYNIVVQIASPDPHAEDRHRQLWRNGAIDGVLWLVQPFPDNLGDLNCPIVSMNCEPRLDVVAHAVNSDVYAGTKLAVSHLMSMGHSRIAYVAGPPAYWLYSQRRRAYLDAMSAAGYQATVTEGDVFEDSGVHAVERLWTTASAPPTAVLAGGDLLALGVIRGLSRIGLRVPDDVAVIGSDGIDVGPYIDPPLTTILSNIYQAARRATGLLLDSIEHPGSAPDTTVLPTEMLVRRSCGYFRDRPSAPAEVAVSTLSSLSKRAPSRQGSIS